MHWYPFELNEVGTETQVNAFSFLDSARSNTSSHFAIR